VEVVRHARLDPATAASRMPSVWLPFGDGDPGLAGVSLEVEIEVPGGEELARHTLNPRLGIVGGISILGTTGLVKPFSHEAYRETIAAELSVAAANGCRVVVLTTGGKSEKFARRLLAELPAEAFVQIADFLAFAAQRVRAMGFETAVMAAFFGKTVKIAQGHDCTHAHEHPLELPFLGEIVAACGGEPSLAASVSGANTAREALVLLRSRDAGDVIGAVCRLARERFQGLLGQGVAARTLLFDYDGTLLADVT
jgi:cobalt-precorrin-5B (C1)-methyltransferase